MSNIRASDSGIPRELHVEKSIAVELSHCGAVAAFYIIGIYFELRLGIDVRFFGGTEVAVGLYGRGFLLHLDARESAR